MCQTNDCLPCLPQLNLDSLPELIGKSVASAAVAARPETELPPRLAPVRPLSEFTGLRKSTTPRLRRPFTQQHSLREMPIQDRHGLMANPNRDDPNNIEPEVSPDPIA